MTDTVIQTSLKLADARLASFLLHSGPAYSSGLSPDPGGQWEAPEEFHLCIELQLPLKNHSDYRRVSPMLPASFPLLYRDEGKGLSHHVGGKMFPFKRCPSSGLWLKDVQF